MQNLTTNVIRFTPPVEQLLPCIELKCTQPDCTSIFNNAGNLEMHLLKHHKVSSTTSDKQKNKIFFCPDKSCMYNASKVEGKHFKYLKYLRQHYQKVHITKSHACSQCGKLFITPGLLKSHQIHLCGKKFVCPQCGWQYDNREALLLHGRRKGHDVRSKEPKLASGSVLTKAAIPRLKKMIHTATLVNNQHQETQTEASLPEKCFRVTGAQTDFVQTNFSNTTDICFNTNSMTDTATYTDGNSIGSTVDFPLHLCDIQTQTELQDSRTNNLLDQMFAHSTHMHTQTCDDFLSELGLADIQTQTNWSNLNDDRSGTGDIRCGNEDVKRDYNATPTGAYDELLVTTETQTSFTQCLFDSCSTTTQESSVGGPFSGLYNTQHTQTCDTLLEGLFGSQESDFMGTFQSTYTQT